MTWPDWTVTAWCGVVAAWGWFLDNWRDCLNVAATLATVGAAVLAYLAIRDSRAQAKKSADNLVNERRTDFELDVLKELADINRAGGRVDDMVVRLNLLPDDLLPAMRSRWQVGQPADADERRATWQKLADEQKVDWASFAQRDCTQEITDAIRSRLERRPS